MVQLYCPTCSALFEEPEERVNQLGGQLACRVCRDILVAPEAGHGVERFNTPREEQAESIIEPEPAPVLEPEPEEELAKTEMFDLAQVFTADSDGKTTVLDLPAQESLDAKTTVISVSPELLASVASRQAEMASSQPESSEPSVLVEPSFGAEAQESSDNRQPSQFHEAKTVIFDVPTQPSAPVPAQGPAYPGASSEGDKTVVAMPHQPGQVGGRYRQKVVVGGAASTDQKTQMFDPSSYMAAAASMPPQTGQAQDFSAAVPPQNQVVLPGAGGPVMSGVQPPGQYAGYQQAQGSSPGIFLIVGLLLLAFVLLVSLYFLVQAVWGGADEADEVATEAVVALSGERLMQNLRGEIQPVLLMTGPAPQEGGDVLGIATHPEVDGGIEIWSVTSAQPQAASLGQNFLERLGPGGLVTLLVDRGLELQQLVDVIEEFHGAQSRVQLASGSRSGEDVYFGFLLDPLSHSPDVQIWLGRDFYGVSLSGGQVDTVSFQGNVPIAGVVQAYASLGVAGESSAVIRFAPGLQLQSLFSLLQGLSDQGSRAISFQLVVDDGRPAPPAVQGSSKTP